MKRESTEQGKDIAKAKGIWIVVCLVIGVLGNLAATYAQHLLGR